MSRLSWIFIFLLVSVLGLEAANNTCVEDIFGNGPYQISQLHNKTTAINHTITGKVGSNITNIDPSDYFKFTAGASGVLKWDIVADEKISIYVQKSCKLVPNIPQTTNASGEIAFKKGETIYVSVHRTVGGKADYTLNLSYQPRSFTASFSDNFKGDVQIIGNTILAENKSNKPVEPAATGTKSRNNDIPTMYYKVDNSSGIFSSSSAELQMPQDAKVEKAYLYWQGIMRKESDVTDKNHAIRTIKLKTPTTGGYKDLSTNDEGRGGRFDWIKYNSKAFAYQGFVEVTDYVQQSGNYIVANLTTTIKEKFNPGAYGAWAIVVVYSDDNSSLKNITVFDGFDEIKSRNEKTYTLSGFYTPENGVVNSKFLVFAGEGDEYYDGDYIELDKTKLEINKRDKNAFHSGITKNGDPVANRVPYYKNNIGIDIHTIDVGSSSDQNITKNGQSSVEIKLGTSSDAYYPSVFAFATDLYEPNVCYDNEKVYLVKGGNEIELKSGDPIPSGSRLRIEATIKNNGNETAKKVRISHDYEGFANFVSGSLKINGVDQSDDVVCNEDNSEKANFDDGYVNAQGLSVKKAFFHLGNGATCDTGGTMKNVVNDNSVISFAKDLNGSGNLVLRYKVDYSQGATDIPFVDTQISHCRGLPPFAGEIRGAGEIVVYEAEIPDTEGTMHRRLLTKQQEWAGDVTYRFAKNEETKHPETTPVKIYKKPITRAECETVAIDWDANPTNFIEGKLNDNKSWTYNIKNFDAAREYVFAYKISEATASDGEMIEEVTGCTDESFAIRPAYIYIENDTFFNKKVKDSISSGKIEARTKLEGGVKSKGYNQTLELSSSLGTVGLEGCTVNQIDESENSIIYDYANSLAKNGSLIFSDQEDTKLEGEGHLSFADVGKFELVLKDSDWTKLDRGNFRCLDKEDENDEHRRIACDFNGTIHVEIIPNELNMSITDRRSWSYMSDESAIDGEDELGRMYLGGVVEGFKILEPNTKELARNLSAGCYDQVVTVDLISQKSKKWKFDHKIGGNGKEFTGGDRNDTHLKHSWKNDSGDHRIGQFQEGEAPFSVYAAVDRISPNAPRAKEELKELTLKLESDLEAKGTDIKEAERKATHDHTFYYGRFYAPRNITSYKNTAEINYQLEIYCPAGGCMGGDAGMLNNWQVAVLDDNLTKPTSITIVDENGKGLNRSETIEPKRGKKYQAVPISDESGYTTIYHHKIPHYLWYGAYVNSYDDLASLEKKDCSSHPCTEIKFQGNPDEWGGTAGDQDSNRIEAKDKSDATQDVRPRINW